MWINGKMCAILHYYADPVFLVNFYFPFNCIRTFSGIKWENFLNLIVQQQHGSSNSVEKERFPKNL